jgi:hypothetical protein
VHGLSILIFDCYAFGRIIQIGLQVHETYRIGNNRLPVFWGFPVLVLVWFGIDVVYQNGMKFKLRV